jgi:flagellar FliL protein
MADKPEAAEKKPDAGGGKSKLVPMLAVGIVALGVGGGAAWFLKPAPEKPAKHEKTEEGEEASGEHAAPEEEGGGEEAAAEAEGGEEGEGEAGEATGPAPLSERLISLDPFVVNLDESGAKRFLKTRIELETASPAKKATLQTRSAQMRDTIIVLLTSKRLEDLGGFEGKVILKNEIERRLNDLLGEDQIRSVLITEFVIQ